MAERILGTDEILGSNPSVSSMLNDIGRKVVEGILKDLTDRRGLRQEWEAIDTDVQEEIKASWAKIVERCVSGEETPRTCHNCTEYGEDEDGDEEGHGYCPYWGGDPGSGPTCDQYSPRANGKRS